MAGGGDESKVCKADTRDPNKHIPPYICSTHLAPNRHLRNTPSIQSTPVVHTTTNHIIEQSVDTCSIHLAYTPSINL